MAKGFKMNCPHGDKHGASCPDKHMGHDFSVDINDDLRRWPDPWGKQGHYVNNGAVLVGGKQSYNPSKSGFGVGTDSKGKHAGTGLRDNFGKDEKRMTGSAKDAS